MYKEKPIINFKAENPTVFLNKPTQTHKTKHINAYLQTHTYKQAVFDKSSKSEEVN